MLPDKLGRQRWHLFAVRVPHGSAVRQQDLSGVHQGGRCQRSWVSPPNYLHLLLGTKQSTVLETPWWWTAWISWAAFWRRTWSPLLLLAPSAHLSGLLQDPVADLWSRVQGCASIKRRQLLLTSAQLRRLLWRLLSLLTLFVIHFFPFLVFLLFTFLLFFGRNVWPPFFSSSPLFCLQPQNSHLIHLLPLLGTYLNKVGVPRLLPRFHWLVLASMDKEIVRQRVSTLRATDVGCHATSCFAWDGTEEGLILSTCRLQVQEDLPLADTYSLYFSYHVDLPVVVMAFLQPDGTQPAELRNAEVMPDPPLARAAGRLSPPFAFGAMSVVLLASLVMVFLFRSFHQSFICALCPPWMIRVGHRPLPATPLLLVATRGRARRTARPRREWRWSWPQWWSPFFTGLWSPLFLPPWRSVGRWMIPPSSVAAAPGLIPSLILLSSASPAASLPPRGTASAPPRWPGSFRLLGHSDLLGAHELLRALVWFYLDSFWGRGRYWRGLSGGAAAAGWESEAVALPLFSPWSPCPAGGTPGFCCGRRCNRSRIGRANSSPWDAVFQSVTKLSFKASDVVCSQLDEPVQRYASMLDQGKDTWKTSTNGTMARRKMSPHVLKADTRMEE